jgi:anti-sigma regulatory factor (Ser/Thr protein kinase)
MSVRQQLAAPLEAGVRVKGKRKSGRKTLERLALPGVVSSGHPLRQSIKLLGGSFAAQPDAVDDLMLAVTEAFSNAIRHGTVTPERGIDVAIACSAEDCRVTLQYPGDPFPVLPPQLPDDSSTTGRGRYLMSVLCDRVEYEFEAGLTRVSLTKAWRSTQV